DRSRGRRRCPRCWYDMMGVPGRRCPECGREARAEARLYRTRRRWRLVSLALVVMTAGMGVGGYPAYQKGWERLGPTTILAAFVPAGDESPQATPATTTMGRFPGPIGIPVPPAASAPSRTLGQRLTDDLWRRLRAGEAWGWQSRLWVQRCMRAGRVRIA